MATTTQRRAPKSLKLQVKEEIFNSISHAVGVGLSVIGLVLLIVKASLNGTAVHVVSFTLYGVTMLLLYSASTFFHGAKNVRKKVVLNKLDHSAIYLLIAGTYTPLALVAIGGVWGWVVFGLEWSLAIGGIVFKLFFYTKRFRTLSAALYLVMGWVGMFAGPLMIEHMSVSGVTFLALGIASYSLGVIFYLWDRLPFAHGVFHLFILAGSIFHFLLILFYLI